jgi:YVTN family beta-propeller protein
MAIPAQNLPSLPTRLRRPVALALVAQGRQLLVANQRSGSITVVDAARRQAIAETDVAVALADLAVGAAGQLVFVADTGANEVIALRRRDHNFDELGRLAVDQSPVSLQLDQSGSRLLVAASWARRWYVVDVARPEELRIVHQLDLPFAPRHQLLLPDGQHVAVTAAFAGHVAVIDIDGGVLRTVQRYPAHNLGRIGLAADGRGVLVPHQILSSDKPTTEFNVHWGDVMLNVVRRIPLVSLLRPETENAATNVDYLGIPDSATGDPAAVLATRDGRQIVACGGTNEIAIRQPRAGYFTRIPVGRRPTALALSPDEKTVYVADTHDDTLHIVDVTQPRVTGVIRLGPQRPLTAVEQGELLFYDARLSSDGWFSCHSCHVDGHTSGMLSDNFADGSTGAPKRIPSLLGTGSAGPWGWQGGLTDLKAQVRSSLETTMRGPRSSDDQVRTLTAYLASLPQPPSILAARGAVDATRADQGKEIFQQSGCADCHGGKSYTSDGIYDVGIHDAAGNVDFNPPSLRGVSQREALFHDNRARGLREVLIGHQHGLAEPLSGDQVEALLEFLRGI